MNPRLPEVLETFWWRWNQSPDTLEEDDPSTPNGRHHPRPLRRDGFWSRVGPFVAVGALSLGLVPLQAMRTASPWLWVGILLIPTIVALGWYLPWDRWPGRAQTVLPLVYVLIVSLLRDATGAHASAFGPLVLIVAVWFALYGTEGELALSLVAIAAMFALPVIVEGGPRYPPIDLLHGGTLVLVGAFVGGRSSASWPNWPGQPKSCVRLPARTR